jgi:hypothetical protein
LRDYKSKHRTVLWLYIMLVALLLSMSCAFKLQVQTNIAFLIFQIQVMQDDQRSRSGMFYTNQKGLVPPLVTTNFITQDQGNSSPRYIRSSMYTVPATIDMMKQVRAPYIIHFFNTEDCRKTILYVFSCHSQV